jgi:CO/xanthine dehydrogenase Mo-binding subunit
MSPDETLLSVDRVRYVGDEVAAVAAETEEAAEEAVAALTVDYEPLPAIFDPEAAIQADAPLVHADRPKNIAVEYHIRHGDVQAAFAAADCVIEQRFKTQVQHQCYIEPYGCVVSPEGGRLTVWTPAQDPFPLAGQLAAVFDLPGTKVRVIQTCIGGSYGGKTRSTRLTYVAALLALKAGRPVRMITKRWEEFAAGRPRVPVIADVKMGFRRDGKILAKQTCIFADNGACSAYAPGTFPVITMRHENQYRIPNIHTDSYLVYTNKVPTGAFRGFGNIQMIFAMESVMDMAARRLGIDPVEMRLRNVVHAGDVTVHGWKIQTDGLTRCLEAVKERIGYTGGERKPNRGYGFSCAIHSSSNRAQPFDGVTARLRLNPDGTVHVLTGDPDMGQGCRTVYAQIVATELEIPLERVAVPSVDTDFSPFGLGNYADRLTTLGGHAVLGAARQLKEAILDAAARLLEANKADLVYQEGSAFVRGSPQTAIPLAGIANRLLWRVGGQTLAVEFTYDPPNTVQRHPQTLMGNTHPTHSFSAQGVEVEVDESTGAIHVLRVVSAHDLGRAINPQSAEGQVEGAVCIGIGYALSEAYQFEDGQTLTNNFADYGIPRAPGVPRIEAVLVETNDPMGPFGAKGIGQTGTLLPAPAIANAVEDAVGVRLTELPMNPDRVLEAILKKRSSDKSDKKETSS